MLHLAVIKVYFDNQIILDIYYITLKQLCQYSIAKLYLYTKREIEEYNRKIAEQNAKKQQTTTAKNYKKDHSYSSDEYNVSDYYSAEDFYDDHYDDFFDYYDAEDYYNDHGGF